ALQAELGRPDAARAAWSRALELDPTFRPALDWLAADARARNAAEDERMVLERRAALPVGPAEPEAMVPIVARPAGLHLAAGRADEAERAARRALTVLPRDREALGVLDRVLSAMGGSRELADLLATRAEVETDFDAIVELLFRRAALLEHLGDRR